MAPASTSPATEDPASAVVQQLHAMAELCDAVDVEHFRAPAPELHGSSLGQHLRHCLDHVAAFLAGLPSGEIDYDARDRDTGIEDEPAAAADLARRLAADLGVALRCRSWGNLVKVRCACGTAGERLPQISSLGRELQFLVSHGVHHLAMVAASCRSHDVEVSDHLGVAPSTLRHRASQTDR